MPTLLEYSALLISISQQQDAQTLQEQKETTEFAILAPRKIALGANFSCCSCDAGNMANTTEYRRKTEGTRREAFLILREDLIANVF